MTRQGIDDCIVMNYIEPEQSIFSARNMLLQPNNGAQNAFSLQVLEVLYTRGTPNTELL